MRILLHICCGPCSLMPLALLKAEGHAPTGYFDNPNIHPLTEYLRRRQGAVQAAGHHAVPLLFPEDQPEYDAEAWCRAALAHPAGRCAFCFAFRLDRAARAAQALRLDAFTSSLLYSRRQNHEGIKQAGEEAAARHGVPFLYRDFRPFWQQGVDESKSLGLYRQQYCGCLFSEQERYGRELERART